MVDHDQKSIKAIGKGEVGDEITRDLLEGAGARGRNGEEWGPGRMGVHLVLLARGTAADITANVRGKARPPKLRSNKLASFEDTGVARSGMVMVTGYDRVAESSIRGDVDAALISQDPCIIMPIGEVRVEGSGGGTGESVESVKDQWVRSRGGAKFVGKRCVDEVDKECVGE